MNRHLSNLSSRSSNNVRRTSGAALPGSDSGSNIIYSDAPDLVCDDDEALAPVMPAIDAVQQLIEEEEERNRLAKLRLARRSKPAAQHKQPQPQGAPSTSQAISTNEDNSPLPSTSKQSIAGDTASATYERAALRTQPLPNKVTDRSVVGRRNETLAKTHLETTIPEEDVSTMVRRSNPLNNLTIPSPHKKPDDYEFILKSSVLDVYSNDPEVKRFLRQLTNISNEVGYNEQDYKCYSCRRPIGMIFGQSKLCSFDGHHYCSECHLGEKSAIPARILCNWDFNKYPISKRNQHFLSLISNEPMFAIKAIAPLLYKVCPELREIEELRNQAFFLRSYCVTCVQESIALEVTKLVWPREHLIKQTDLYSLEDLIQIKSGALKQTLKSVIAFGRQHVLSCVLCFQRGFICELCKSSQIIYPFDTETVHRCNNCHSIYHKSCFKSKTSCDSCPRCERLQARRSHS